jgi:hypothetical protein
VTDTAEPSAAEARLAELAAERARLWDEVQRLRAERRAVEHYEHRFAEMESSLSWRVTTPLRAGKTLAVKVSRRLRDES